MCEHEGQDCPGHEPDDGEYLQGGPAYPGEPVVNASATEQGRRLRGVGGEALMEIRAGDIKKGQTIREFGMDYRLTVEHIEREGDTVYLADYDGGEARLDRDTVVQLVEPYDEDGEDGEDDPTYLAHLYADEAENPL